MIAQKLIIALCFTLLNCFSLIGQRMIPQGMKIKLEKSEYKVGDTISLSFETNVKMDSIVWVDLDQFEIIDNPSANSSISTVNGISSYRSTATYKISPIKPGKMKIIAPAIYSAGSKISGEEKYIEITGKELTPEELKKKEFKKFVNSGKPKGTKIFTIKDDMGYVEISDGKRWIYQRALTKAEIKLLTEIELTNK
jgi:hypothetical protein